MGRQCNPKRGGVVMCNVTANLFTIGFVTKTHVGFYNDYMSLNITTNSFAKHYTVIG